MNQIAEVLHAANEMGKHRLLFKYRPFGHPDTLCPDGRLWKQKKWETWTNKPWQLDFHDAGLHNQERMLMAANRPGKTEAGAAECSFHATGKYPKWWNGKRFNKPVTIWTGSPTNETSRAIVQAKLLGNTGESLGTGYIPKEFIIGKPSSKQAGIADVVDSFKVRHVSGGVSMVYLKTYEQGWRKWQGTEPDVIWLDEEPEANEQQGKILTEALTRLLTSHGILMVTFTPLMGVTNFVEHFQYGGKGIWLGMATWEDAPHLNKEERDRLSASYPSNEREARTKGVPMLGEGRIFTTPEDYIKVGDFPIPHYFGKIKGIDFGIDHPYALVDLAWDRDQDIIYVTRAWKKEANADGDAKDHALEINRINAWVPVAWPHDGTTKEKGNGVKLKDIYHKNGVKMLSKSARTKNDVGGSQPVEPIILELYERFETGALKVFASCGLFFDEYRNFHRKGGMIVAKRDDILKAMMYAYMMRRYVTTQRKTIHALPPRGISTQL